MKRPLLLVCATCLLAACGPKLEAELIAGRTVMITNGEEEPVGITRIVANDADGRSECVDEPGTVLPPGRTYTTTFFLCEEVRQIDIATDQGESEIEFEGS